jgi:hypothetical protein
VSRLGRLLAALVVLAAAGCATSTYAEQPRSPLGWPAAGVRAAGQAAADSEIVLLRETGRLLDGVGELLEAPALLLEGVALLRPRSIRDAGLKVSLGTGRTVTGAVNLPFFPVTGPNVDIGRDAELVNEALAYLDTLPPDTWRYHPDDERAYVFPPGTRCRASGRNLVYTVPGEGEIVQAAEVSPWFWTQQAVAGTSFNVQERSWGFIVASRSRWDRRAPRDRAVTILHELYHQHMQIRRRFAGWSAVYWPLYVTVYPFTGWNDHWAERDGPHAAFVVNAALARWKPLAD